MNKENLYDIVKKLKAANAYGSDTTESYDLDNSDELDINDPNHPENRMPAIEDEVGIGPESIKKQKIMAKGTNIPKGPEGGFRVEDYTKEKEIQNKSSSQNLESLLNKIQQMRQSENAEVSNLNMLRGANQIAQAAAYGQGAKIGDSTEIIDRLQSQAQQPSKDYLELLKQYRQMSPARNDVQILQNYNPETKQVENIAYNKNTGEMTNLGLRGYSPYTYMDPLKGTPTITPRIIGESKVESLPKENITKYKFSDLQKIAPKIATTYVEPIKNEYQKSIGDDRKIATSISAIEAKMGVDKDGAIKDAIDSGVLGSIATQAARMAGQTGVLSDYEIKKFEGAGGAEAWLNRFASGFFKGEVSEDDKNFFANFTKKAKKYIESDIEDRSEMYADQLRQAVEVVLPNFSNENAKEWLSVNQVAPSLEKGIKFKPSQENEYVMIKGPSGETKKIQKDKAKKYLDKPGYELVK